MFTVHSIMSIRRGKHYSFHWDLFHYLVLPVSSPPSLSLLSYLSILLFLFRERFFPTCFYIIYIQYIALRINIGLLTSCGIRTQVPKGQKRKILTLLSQVNMTRQGRVLFTAVSAGLSTSSSYNSARLSSAAAIFDI